MLHCSVRRILQSLGVAFLLCLTFATTTIPSYAASKITTQKPSATCHQLLVYLHGNAPATSKCLDQTHTGVIQNTTTDNGCTSYDLKIYSDPNYQGSMICFIGTGFVNMTQYWLFWPVTWNDQASSFYGGCTTGTFYTNTNGWGQTQNFGQYAGEGNFDGQNGDLPDNTLSSISIATSC